MVCVCVFVCVSAAFQLIFILVDCKVGRCVLSFVLAQSSGKTCWWLPPSFSFPAWVFPLPRTTSLLNPAIKAKTGWHLFELFLYLDVMSLLNACISISLAHSNLIHFNHTTWCRAELRKLPYANIRRDTSTFCFVLTLLSPVGLFWDMGALCAFNCDEIFVKFWLFYLISCQHSLVVKSWLKQYNGNNHSHVPSHPSHLREYVCDCQDTFQFSTF